MKKAIMLALVALLIAGVSFAEEQEQGGFWYTLLKKLNTISTRGPSGKTYTSVVGIRGDKDTSSDELYWKGEAQKKQAQDSTVSEQELSDFRLAVDQATEGEREQAMASFKTFLGTYPNSELIADAKAAIHQLETEALPAE